MAKNPSLLDILALLPAGEVARTAASLGLTPELLRKRLQSLETALATGLLGSATRALKPAETGKLVLEHAGRILSQARDFTRDLEELAGLQSPEIIFGTDMFVAQLPLGPTLGRMYLANPRLRVRTSVADFDELTNAVLAGRLEFAIADTAGAERHPSKLHIEPIAECPLFFFGRRAHPLAGEAAPSLAAILGYPLAMSRIPQRIAVHFAKEMPQARADRETGDLAPGLSLDEFAVAKQVVETCDAIGLAPLAAIEPELRTRKLALLPFDAAWLHLSYGLLRLRKRGLSRAAQLFVTQLRQVDAEIQARQRRSIARLPGARAAPRARRSTARKTAPRRRSAR